MARGPRPVVAGLRRAAAGASRQPRGRHRAQGRGGEPPPEPGRTDPISDAIYAGQGGPGFNAQNKMLDEHAKKYNLRDQDWRLEKPWYKPAQ